MGVRHGRPSPDGRARKLCPSTVTSGISASAISSIFHWKTPPSPLKSQRGGAETEGAVPSWAPPSPASQRPAGLPGAG